MNSILKRAFEKVVNKLDLNRYVPHNGYSLVSIEDDGYKDEYIYLCFSNEKNSWRHQILREKLIFSHEFAKAFWGDKLCTMRRILQDDTFSYEEAEYPTTTERLRIEGLRSYYCNGDKHHCYMWQYHLQQMVLEENPLKYLEKFL
jgi:hypothetical protein